jgi:hypothetical protein
MISTRFNVARLDAKLTRALRIASGGKLEGEIQQEVWPVKEAIESKIRASGRGAEHNADFARQDLIISTAGSGRLNIRFGWVNPPAHSAERGTGGNLWYQYQDKGFWLFGGDNWIEGVGATIDRREDFLEAIRRAVDKYADDIAREMNR